MTATARGISVDGEYGPRTEDAVRHVQVNGRITNDGVYGPDTRKVMKWMVFYPNGGSTGDCR